MNTNMIRKVERCLKYLPFEVRVNGTEAQPASMSTGSEEAQQQQQQQQKQQNGDSQTPMMEQTFPCSLLTTMGNFFHPRLVLLLHWRGLDLTRVATTSSDDSDVQSVLPMLLYSKPSMEVDEESRARFLQESANDNNNNNNDNDSSSIPISACLTEFCKEQSLNMDDNWKCPKCKAVREGKQSLHLWRVPDLLTFHIKRFNCSARWREKITTKVDFPLTGLDMAEWMHEEASPLRQGQHTKVVGSDDGDANFNFSSTLYDLVGVVNHIGGMTGGHYVATCKTSPCSADGVEDQVLAEFKNSHSLEGDGSMIGLSRSDSMLSSNNNNGGTNDVIISNQNNSTSTRNGISSKIRQTMRNKEKDATVALQQRAQMATKSVLESNDPLWLQFDDELVEPIPQRNICTEAAYVLFYRRRRLTSANVAKYSTLD